MYARRLARAVALLGMVAALAHPAASAQAATVTTTDFNGDGYNDLAVGSPEYPGLAGTSHSGLVTVLYGGPNGLSGHDQIRPKADCWSGYVEQALLPCAQWGLGLTSADLDGDGRKELISAGWRDTRIHSWKPTGISTRNTTDVLRYSFYLGALTAGQLDSDPKIDVAAVWGGGSYTHLTGGWYNNSPFAASPIHPDGLGITRSVATGLPNSGTVQQLVAVGYRADRQDTQLWYVGEMRKPGKPYIMGSQAACGSTDPRAQACPKQDSKIIMGRVNADQYDDLVMVTPSTGTINVWYGSYYALGVSYPEFTARNVPWLAPFAQSRAEVSLAVGDVNGDGFGEIAIGDRQATVSGQSAAGMVALVPGSAAGPVTSGARLISQDGDSGAAADPVPGQSTAGDGFGAAVSLLDVTGDGKAELLIGAPGKDSGRGMLAVLPGTTATAFPTAQIVRAQDAGAVEPAAKFASVLLR